MLKEVIKNTRFISYFFPKDKKKIIFYSIPDFSGNSRFLFEKIHERYGDKFQYFWLVENKNTFNKAQYANTKFVDNNIEKIYRIFTSKYLVSSHRKLNYLKIKTQKKIELWHGMPLKAMGHMENKKVAEIENFFSRSDDYFISTSPLTKMFLSSCFNLEPQKILVTGQPRNDMLHDRIKSVKNIEELIGTGIDNKKVIFYLPTFREGYGGRFEGHRIEDDNIFRVENFSLPDFKNFLAEKNYMLIMKLHPFEEKIYESKIADLENENLKIITTKQLAHRGLDLYQILGGGDLLITDYSSVYFDTLIKNIPVLFCISDKERYSEKRGFLLEPFDFWTPGPKVQKQDHLEAEIIQLVENENYYNEERKTVHGIINRYSDSKSGERIIEAVFEGKKENFL